MPRPLRPPRGIFSPTGLLFDPKLTDPVKTTAMQLRALGWGKEETPPLSMLQICQELGKGQTTVYGHMRLLRDRGALRWRPAGTTEIIVSFPAEYWLCENAEEPLYENLQKPYLDSQDLKASQNEEQVLSSEEGLSTEALNYPLQKAVKPEKTKKQAAKPSGWHYSIAHALAEVCHMDFEGNRGRLFSEAKQMEKSSPEPTPELLRQHYNSRADCYWRKHDWRGQKGQDPTPWAIRQTWGKWVYVATAPDNEPAGWAALDEVKRMRKESANGH
jgi:hypothetical protein